MFRIIAVPLVLLCVTGCVEGSIAPGNLPKGAMSGIYTTADVQTVASCIAAVTGGTVQPEGDRMIIASVRHVGLRYSVGPNRRDIVYPTQIAIIGTNSDTIEPDRIGRCATSSGTVR